MKKLEEAKDEVKKWKKQAFGDVRVEKKAIMERIGKLDEKESSGELDENSRSERGSLKKRLEELILREDISWYKKARIKGVNEWDNLKLFYRIVSGR